MGVGRARVVRRDSCVCVSAVEPANIVFIVQCEREKWIFGYLSSLVLLAKPFWQSSYRSSILPLSLYLRLFLSVYLSLSHSRKALVLLLDCAAQSVLLLLAHKMNCYCSVRSDLWMPLVRQSTI